MPDAPPPSLLPVLKWHRDVTLRELAEQAGTTHGHLSRVATEKKPMGDDLALRLEKALGQPEGSYRETQAALVRQALADDPHAIGALYRALRRHRRAQR